MKKRILIVAESCFNLIGGIQKVINTSTMCLKNYYDFDLVVFDGDVEEYKKTASQFKNIYFCNLEAVNLGSKKANRIIKRLFAPIVIYSFLKKLLKSKKYDVVHCHDFNKGAWALLAANRHDIKKRVIHAHNPLTTDPKSFFLRIYSKISLKIALKNSTERIGVSETASSIYSDAGYSSIIINNPIEIEHFLNQPKSQREDNTIRFIHVGRFAFQKNHEFLIKTYKQIHNLLPNTNLTLIGWGEKENEIKTQIENLGLSNNIIVLPGNSDVPKEFSKADYMIFPSHYEGLGIVLVEAQTSGVFCFASDVVPKSTDVGLCNYYSLNAGPSVWAKNITDFINSNSISNYEIDKEKLAAFDLSEVIKKYKAIYES